MQRVYWTVDLLEAHAIAGFLRSQGIEARVFDADFVRQDWLAALAYGGYRVVVAGGDVAAARDLLARRRNGQFALPDEDHAAPCPRCGSLDVHEDPTWRRVAFAVLFLLQLPIARFKWRYCCGSCGNRWRSPPERTFRELAASAEGAESPR